MKYSKDLFIDNVNYLVKYGYEPEVTIKTQDNEFFIIAHAEFVDLGYDLDKMVRLSNIEDVFSYVNFDDVIEITGDIDYEFPILSQSVVSEGKLWMNGVSPKEEIKQYKKHSLIFRTVGSLFVVALLAYVTNTVLDSETFDKNVMIACSVFVGSIAIFMLLFTLFDIRRNNIIKRYYGTVSEEDREKAKELLEKFNIVDKNEYDFYDELRFDNNDAAIETVLKLLTKGKKVFFGLYTPIKDIEQELIVNKESKKYDDEEYNNYISELISLLENNLCDI